MTNRFGVVFSGHFPLRRMLDAAVLAEQLGFGTCWLGEDFFYHGGIATATAVAERSSQITIGLGVLSPLPRHPALTAMEVATLDEIANGRVILGIGNGVPAWMRQMHIMPRSPLAAMREGLMVCRQLMAGETVTLAGTCFSLDQVKLGFSPHRRAIPIYLGVEGPRGLELSGEVADGTVISIFAGPAYVRWAREHIIAGAAAAGRTAARHEMVVYVVTSISDDVALARDAVRRTLAEYVAAGGPTFLTRLAGVPDDRVAQMQEVYRTGRVPVEMVDDSMIEQLAVVGKPAACQRRIAALFEAGADQVVFFPFPSEHVEEQLQRLHELFPTVPTRPTEEPSALSGCEGREPEA